MNFFTVGFLLANLQLNANWASGYFIRLVGALFMLGGIAELAGFEKKVLSLRPICWMLAVLSAASGVTMLFVSGKTDVIARAACLLDAMVTMAMTAIAFRSLFRMLKEETFLVGNEPEVKKNARGYDRLLAVIALSMLADCVNRFTSGAVADGAGVVMAGAKIVSYCLLAAGTFGFNRMRGFFNDGHPIE